MRTITLEEHFATPEFLDGPGSRFASDPAFAARLADLGTGRIAEMDAAGIDVQVLSLGAPGVEQSPPAEALALARSTNDALARAVGEHPERFAGLAAVPTPDPAAAADELDRAVSELGMVGAVLNGHAAGRYLDDAAFAPLLARAEALSAPLYLHPTRPPEPVAAGSYSGLSPEVDAVFATSGWGWHVETSVHLLRMVLGGVFDRHPGLQVVVGHMGEGLPFFWTRLGRQFPPELTGLASPVPAYLRRHVHYTFAGFNDPALFALLRDRVGVERMMFSADHPFQPMDAAREFLDGLPVTDAERERIAHGNAETLFGL